VSEREVQRGPFLSVMASLFGLLALSNSLKAVQHMVADRLGFVFFGIRFESVAANLLLGLPFALLLAAYARGLWTMRRWVVPISIGYAFYVPTNLVLFWFFDARAEPRPVMFIVVYLFFALGGSIGTALYLCWHRERLS
jgi:hypothetical protein